MTDKDLMKKEIYLKISIIELLHLLEVIDYFYRDSIKEDLHILYSCKLEKLNEVRLKMQEHFNDMLKVQQFMAESLRDHFGDNKRSSGGHTRIRERVNGYEVDMKKRIKVSLHDSALLVNYIELFIKKYSCGSLSKEVDYINDVNLKLKEGMTKLLGEIVFIIEKKK